MTAILTIGARPQKSAHALDRSLHPFGEQLVPITELIAGGQQIGAALTEFCYEAVISACRAFLAAQYSSFDAHTVTNCCHGVAVLAQEVLWQCSTCPIAEICDQASDFLRRWKDQELHVEFTRWRLPGPIVFLTKLYLLAQAASKESTGVRISRPEELQRIYSLGTKFSRRLVKNLQREISNLVAARYSQLARRVTDANSCGVSIAKWAEYAERSHIREDKRGRQYAPAIFSMQVVLAYLARLGAPIALRCDLVDESGEFRSRYTKIVRGHLRNRTGSLRDQADPVVVFHGFCRDSELKEEHFQLRLNSWSQNIDSLILANDLHYPQYPRVIDDPEFDCSPISPRENEIVSVLQRHSALKGVSAEDPHLFCLSHVFVASSREILSAKGK